MSWFGHDPPSRIWLHCRRSISAIAGKRLLNSPYRFFLITSGHGVLSVQDRMTWQKPYIMPKQWVNIGQANLFVISRLYTRRFCYPPRN